MDAARRPVPSPGWRSAPPLPARRDPTTVVVAQPAYVAPQPVYVAQGNVPIGTQYAALPSGAQSMVVNGVNYYQSGPTWYKPYFGSSGVYYEVVPAP